MRRTKEIKIDASELLDAIIWPATRYCIGRHTYVSYYARDYWDIIRRNRKAFNEERLQFYARDIRDYIAQSMRWWKNVEVEGTGNDRIKYDPYFLLCRYLYEHPDCDFASTDFGINCMNGVVRAYKRETPLSESEMAYSKAPDCDLEEWSRLACCISQAFTIEIGDKKREVFRTYVQARYGADEPWHWELELMLTDEWGTHINMDYLKKNHPEALEQIKEEGE